MLNNLPDDIIFKISCYYASPELTPAKYCNIKQIFNKKKIKIRNISTDKYSAAIILIFIIIYFYLMFSTIYRYLSKLL